MQNDDEDAEPKEENDDSESDANDDTDENEDDEEDEDADLSPVELDDLALPSDVEESEEEPEKKEDQGTTLFVRNIQFEATEDELFAL